MTLPLYSDTNLLMAVIDTTHAMFVVEVLGLLAIPGPTNSLLFVSGMSHGFRASLNLILAEVGAYFISISSLVLGLEPVTRTYSTVPQLLRVARNSQMLCTPI